MQKYTLYKAIQSQTACIQLSTFLLAFFTSPWSSLFSNAEKHFCTHLWDYGFLLLFNIYLY